MKKSNLHLYGGQEFNEESINTSVFLLLRERISFICIGVLLGEP